MKVKSFITSIFILLFALNSFSQEDDLGEERITDFHSVVHVRKNCTVEITELISVVSRGNEINHGIVRSMPLSYDYEGGRTDVGFTIKSVKLDGETEDYHTESATNGVLIYIGSKETLLEDGYHIFELTYVVEHVLGFFPKYDEFYWNVNGTDSKFSMDTVSAEIYFPKDANYVKSYAYTGPLGAKGKDFTSYEIEGGGVYFETTKGLGAFENLSVAVAWEKNHLVYPTGMDNFLFWLKSHFLWVIGILGLLITLIYNSVIWFKYGRDPKPGTIMPLYEAPKGFSPADAAFLYNYGRKTGNMFTGQLVGLATKGHLTIDVSEGSKKTYTITKTDAPAGRKSELLPLEEQFYSQLFAGSDTLVLRQGSYNPHLKDTQDELVEQVRETQGETYILKRNRYKLQQFVVPVIAVIIGLLGSVYFGGMLAIPIVFFFVCVVVNIIFGVLYEQPTPLGRKMLDELAGYKMYMQYADRERIKLMNPPTMDFEHFEANLPYAIALNVADQWSQKFDQAELQRGMSGVGYWYTGMMMGSMMHAFDFREMTTTISSASTPPSSSSSGSGGGGFSGGGGGGGGVGGW